MHQSLSSIPILSCCERPCSLKTLSSVVCLVSTFLSFPSCLNPLQTGFRQWLRSKCSAGDHQGLLSPQVRCSPALTILSLSLRPDTGASTKPHHPVVLHFLAKSSPPSRPLNSTSNQPTALPPKISSSDFSEAHTFSFNFFIVYLTI